jgi:hypothetical protein
LDNKGSKVSAKSEKIVLTCLFAQRKVITIVKRAGYSLFLPNLTYVKYFIAVI